MTKEARSTKSEKRCRAHVVGQGGQGWTKGKPRSKLVRFAFSCHDVIEDRGFAKAPAPATRYLQVINVVVLVLIVCLSATTARCENWPGWRGPGRNGVSSETGIPTEWSESKGILWKVPLIDSGGSPPIVWDDKVLVTAADGPRKSNLHVICFERDTGKELWHRQLWGTAPTLYHDSKGSMATPAPVTDGVNIYAFFGTGDVFSLDMAGHLNWQRSLANEYGEFENRFGASSSPLLFEDSMILKCDH